MRDMSLIKGGYYIKVSSSDWVNVFWEVVDDHVVEVSKKNNEIGLQIFNFLFYKYQWGERIQVLSYYTYLLRLIEICPGDW